jgi:hypothetical protein
MKAKKYLIASIIFLATVLLIAWLSKDTVLSEMKSRGYLEYTPDEAISLAYSKCSGCHNSAQITNYCFRCGPPFIVVVRNMRELLALEKSRPGREGLHDISDAEAVTIVQVWNALIGNWEEGWRKEDLIKMLQDDTALIDLVSVSPSDRKIEAALFGKKVAGAARDDIFDPKGMTVK